MRKKSPAQFTEKGNSPITTIMLNKSFNSFSLFIIIVHRILRGYFTITSYTINHIPTSIVQSLFATVIKIWTINSKTYRSRFMLFGINLII